MPASPESQWQAVLAAGVAAQKLVPGSIAVGGSAAALYAKHRFSNDTDHLVSDLKDRFDEVRDRLEHEPGWTTARVSAPVLILGSLGGVEVGFRQSRRCDLIATTTIQTPAGPLVVPTLDEMLGMKAYMAYSRNAVRDYVDFAALAAVAGDVCAIAAVMKSDSRYGHLQASSVALSIAQRLCDPQPFDGEEVDLRRYKNLTDPWRDWASVAEACTRIGVAVLRSIVLEE